MDEVLLDLFIMNYMTPNHAVKDYESYKYRKWNQWFTRLKMLELREAIQWK